MTNIDIGRKGESLATKYLENKGYKIEENNYRLSTGEIDIIAYDNDILTFIEVKTRRSDTYGNPFESVDNRKQEKIINTGLNYMVENQLHDIQVRFDIIEVYLIDGYKINHIQNAFT